MCCELKIQDLGKIAYEDAFEVQLSLQKHVSDSRGDFQDPFHLLLLEHDPPVVTISKRPSAKKHLLATPQQLADAGVVVCETNRGGDITYHGPGQVVGYPILDLENFFTDIHKYLRLLEETIILTLAEYGIKATRSDGETGVWLDVGTPFARKICAMGVRASRWVTMHGFALNVNTDLGYFDNIIPCGIRGKAVTSLRVELNLDRVDENQVKEKLLKHFLALFEADLA